MKVYIGHRKVKGKLEYGVTVYSDCGKVLFSNTKSAEDTKDKGKFTNTLNNLVWGIKQVNLQTERGLLSCDDNIILLVGNKTIYNWFESQSTTRQYAVEFSDLLFEINLLINDIEIIYADNSVKKVLFCKRNTKDEGGLTKLSDMFTDMGY